MLRILISLIVLTAALVWALPADAQTAAFSISKPSGCAPHVVSLTNTTTGATGTTRYFWDFGNGTTSTIAAPQLSYPIPGVYIITLTATRPGPASTATGQVTVYANPVVTFLGSNLSGCSPLPTRFTSSVIAGAPGDLTYEWVFGDGKTDTAANPAHVFQNAGSFDILLQVKNGAGCPGTASQNAYVTAWPRPTPALTASPTTSLCIMGSPGTVSFNASAGGASAPYTYRWDFGDHTPPGTGTPAPHDYATGGIYSVVLTATDARGCTDSVRYANYITVESTVPAFTVADTCIGEYLTFRNTTGTGSTASWDFGDGSTDINDVVTYRYSAAGTYNAAMTVTVGGCRKTVTRQVVVYPRPKATISMTPAIPCEAPATLSFTATADMPIRSYAWTWRNGGSDTGRNVTKTYTQPAADQAKLVFTSEHGCADSVTLDTFQVRDINQTITQIKGDDSSAMLTGGCLPYTVHFGKIGLSYIPPGSSGATLPYPADIVSYDWDFGDGGTSHLQYPQHTYPVQGNFRGRSVITTSNGCIDTLFFFVSVDTPKPPRYVMSADSVCFKDRITFTNLTPNITPGSSFRWLHVKEYKTVDTQSLVLEIRDEAFNNIILYSDNNGCVDSFVSPKGFVILPPISKFDDSIYCWPSTRVRFRNRSIGPTSQLWLFGDGTTDTAFAPVHTYPGAGLYAPRLVSYNSTSGCRDTGNTGVITAAFPLGPPVYDIAASDTIACVGQEMLLVPVVDSIPFSATYPGTFAWIIDSTYVAPTMQPFMRWTFTTPGPHDITLMITFGMSGCPDTLSKKAFITAARPEVRFSADITDGCVPVRINFTDSTRNPYGTQPVSRTWNFGDLDSVFSMPNTISHSYKKPGTYDLKVVVMDSLGCRDSLIRPNYIRIHQTIAAFAFQGPDSACTGSVIAFRNGTTGFGPLRYQWDFGDGTTDTARDPRHTYLQDGDYQLRLVATDTLGCADTIRRNRTIHVSRPKAAFTKSDGMSLCPPLIVSFNNRSAKNSEVEWNFGDGSQIIPTENPVKTYTAAGQFTVTLIAKDPAGCADTAYDTIRVLGYNGAFSFNPPSGCAPLQVQFNPLVNGIPLLVWDFNDGSIDTTFNSAPASHSYSHPGAYLPRVILTGGRNCPPTTSYALDSVYVDGVQANFEWSVPCADTPFTLTDHSTARYGAPARFEWSSPRATASGTGNPGRLTLPASGTFPVKLIMETTAGCRDSITKDVFVNALPAVFAGPDTTLCPGDTARLVAAGALSYTWATSTLSPDAGLTCSTCDTALGWIRERGVFTLSGRDSNGCYGRDSLSVSIQLKTTSTTGTGGSICYGESFRLNASGAMSYQWLPAETVDNPAIANPLATPKTTTTYTVISREGSCEADTQRVPVVVRARPQFTAGPDKTVSLGSAATLESAGSYKTIRWLNNDSTLSCLDCPRPNAHPYYTRIYRATVTDEWGCEATDSVTVFVRCNGSEIFLPNTFTPNGDGQNDWFYPQGTGIDRMTSFRVYNRWGELVFENLNAPLNNPGSGWDGRYKGSELAPDTYVYLIVCRCPGGEQIRFKGDVTLLR